MHMLMKEGVGRSWQKKKEGRPVVLETQEVVTDVMEL